MRTWTCACGLLMLALPARAGGATLRVGPGQRFARPSEAVRAARDGDTIEIDAAGRYDGDVCEIRRSRLVLRGVGEGRARLDAAGRHCGGKGIWVVKGDDVTVENIEFTGARVRDRNGAGIRQEGRNLTVRNCSFHHNENGILGGGGAESVVVIEHSEFAHNGHGDGQSHNLYIGRVRRLVFRHNDSHHARIGHLLKSRAAENHILYNRLADEADGTSSYVVNLPEAGRAWVVGNVLHQGPRTENGSLLAYGEEGNRHPDASELYVVHNTFVNDRAKGGTFVNVRDMAGPVVVRNNVFAGRGRLCTFAKTREEGNFSGGDPLFVDRARYDFRLRRGSPCIDRGVEPGRAGELSLAPVFQYVHPHARERRPDDGRIDIGAFEFTEEERKERGEKKEKQKEKEGKDASAGPGAGAPP